MIEPPEVFVFGPYMTNSDGKPGTVIPRWACAPPAHASAQRAPAGAGDLHREHEVGRPEAGAPDDAVDLVQRAVGGARRRPARAA